MPLKLFSRNVSAVAAPEAPPPIMTTVSLLSLERLIHAGFRLLADNAASSASIITSPLSTLTSNLSKLSSAGASSECYVRACFIHDRNCISILLTNIASFDIEACAMPWARKRSRYDVRINFLANSDSSKEPHSSTISLTT